MELDMWNVSGWILQGNASEDKVFFVNELTELREFNTMHAYHVLQIIFMLLFVLAGVITGCHLIFFKAGHCKNWGILTTTLIVGLFQILICVFFLDMSERSTLNLMSLGRVQKCIDYSPTATLSNAVILFVIAVNIVLHNWDTFLKRLLLISTLLICSTSGLVILFRDMAFHPTSMQQEVFATLGYVNYTHIEIFWTVCLKEITAEYHRLLWEYILIYLPVFLIFLKVWATTYSSAKRKSPLVVQIINLTCGVSEKGKSCVCSGFNGVYFAILTYSALILFLARPGMIVYGLLQSNKFRDILPSLLNTVIFCFFSVEYIRGLFVGTIHQTEQEKESILEEHKVV
ncbi:hypothetical protein CHS0354_036460 [Potamilus streckersoni]|uniref:Uncharacterized protein n=1 Tax=Potamilus streckersoni TaxID=2493646 RepID=A0AAE0W376_9BIVA|nr:hypothetical protein CHS0354_036460 [Potamilus streckersoni]